MKETSAKIVHSLRTVLVAACVGICCGALACLGGCNWNKGAKTSKAGDPLMGDVHPKEKSFDSGAHTPSASVKETPAATSLLQPQPVGGSTPASLASRMQPLPHAIDLAIKDPAPAPQISQRALIQGLPSDNNPLVLSAVAWNATQSQNAIVSQERLKTELERRGVFKHQFAPLPDGVRLTAFIGAANSQDFQIVETTGKDASAAFQSLLHQLDERK